MNTRLLALRSLALAKQIAPYDTGNLAFNGIKVVMTNTGFRIDYIDRAAPYVEYLEEGTRHSGKHVGFISQNTVYAVTKLVHDTYNNRKSSETINYKLLAEKSKNNDARKEMLLNQLRK
jgi:hypothetical protein